MLEDRIVTGRLAHEIGVALECVPLAVLERIGGLPPIFEGDVRFSGLSEGDPSSAWCLWNRPHDRLALSFPLRWPDAGTVLHELGHALHWRALRTSWSRRRCYWSRQDQGVRVVYGYTGWVPPLLWTPPRHGDPYREAFAEAFRVWASPRALLDPRDRPERFYNRSGGPINDWGLYGDNRVLLGFFNELAGLPFDTPPRALR